MNMHKKMKLRILSALVLVPLAMMSGCTGDTNTAAGTGNDSVQGVVVDTVSGAPIVGATVKSGWATATTDKSGVYNLGTAPYTINSGNIAMPDATYVVAIDTTTSATATAAAGYNTNYFRRVSVGQVASDANILRIGKLNATVKGNVLNSNGSFAAASTVTLTYVANAGQESTATQNTSPVITASSLSTVTATDGTYTIAKVEAGSQFTLQARNAASTHTTRSNTYQAAAAAGKTYNFTTLPPIDGYVYGGNNGNNDTNLTFAAAPDGNQPLTIISSTVAVGTTAATTVNAGDFAAGATTVTYTFSRAVAASPYTATAGVYQQSTASAAAPATPLASVMNDIDLVQTAKTANIPFTATWGTDMKTLAVVFTTSPAMVYTVDILKVVNKVKDTNGVDFNNGTAAVAPTGKIAFSTSGATALGALAAAPITRTTGTAVGDSTLTIQPVLNSSGYYLYVSKYVNDILTIAPTAFHTSGAKRVLTGSAVDLSAVTVPFNTTTARAAFFDLNADSTGLVSTFAPADAKTAYYDGINKISYKVKAVYLNADKLELAANTTAEFLVDDKTKASLAAAVGVVGSIRGTNTAKTDIAAAATTTAARLIGSSTDPVASKDLPALNPQTSPTGSATPASARTLTGFFSSAVATTLTTPTAYKVIWYFDEQMKTADMIPANFSIADTGTTSTPLTVAYAVGMDTNGAAYPAGSYCSSAQPVANCPAQLTFTATAVSYDSVAKAATVTFNMGFSFTQPALATAADNAALGTSVGSWYEIRTTGLGFRFTYAGTDLNGNTVVYPGTQKGF